MLMNRVDREGRIVAESFDRLTREAVEHLESMYRRIGAVLYLGLNRAKSEGDDHRQACSIILTNALKSLTAAFALLRTGWRLQPYLCLRNALETVSVAVHLMKHPDDLAKLRAGTLDTPKTVSTAKQAVPHIGRLYGVISNEFVHIGKPFLHIQQGNTYTLAEWQMWQCLAAISGQALITYIAAELLFFESLSEHHCWSVVVPGAYRTHWSSEMEQWREHFVRIYGPHYRENPLEEA